MTENDKQMLIRRLQFERKAALEDVGILAARLCSQADEAVRNKDQSMTPGNITMVAGQLEAARQRAITARLSLDLLDAVSE